MAVENYSSDLDVALYGGDLGHKLAEEIMEKRRGTVLDFQIDSFEEDLPKVDLNKLKAKVRRVRDLMSMKPFVDQYLSCRNFLDGKCEVLGTYDSGTKRKVNYHLMGQRIEDWFAGYDTQREMDKDFEADLKGSLEFIAGDHELVISEGGRFRILSKNFMKE